MMPIRYGSICSGIEAASVAWKPLGWQAAWFSEIADYPSELLAHHYPHIQNFGDMRTIPSRILTGEIEAPDVLIGGTPCQAFSVAGKKQSLNDERGLLTLKYVEIVDAIDFIRERDGRAPTIAIWGNVPGVLSTKDNAFGCLVGALAGSGCELQPAGKKWANVGCVYGPKRTVAWRILDAQYFGVPQRRRRVFVVASAGAICPTTILFEPKGVPRTVTPRSGTRNDIAGTLAAHTFTGGCGGRPESAAANLMVVDQAPAKAVSEGSFGSFDHANVAATLRANGGSLSGGSETLVIQNATGICGKVIGRADHNGGNGSGYSAEIAPTLTTADRHAVAFESNASAAHNMPVDMDLSPTLTTNARYMAVGMVGHVRKLMPIECERLQGFPDGYTLIKRKNGEASDYQRYFALGNSMAVPVIRWLGQRIEEAKNAMSRLS